MGCTASRDLTQFVEHRQFGTLAVSKLKCIERATVNSNGHAVGCLIAATPDKLPCRSEPCSDSGSRGFISRQGLMSARGTALVSRARGPRKSMNNRSFPSMAKRRGVLMPEIQGKNHKDGDLRKSNSLGCNVPCTTLSCDAIKHVKAVGPVENTRELWCLQDMDPFGVEDPYSSVKKKLHNYALENTDSSKQLTSHANSKSAVCQTISGIAGIRVQNRNSPNLVHCSDTCVSYYVCDLNCNGGSDGVTNATHSELVPSLGEYCSCMIQGENLMDFIASNQVAVAMHRNFFKDFGDDYDDDDLSGHLLS